MALDMLPVFSQLDFADCRATYSESLRQGYTTDAPSQFSDGLDVLFGKIGVPVSLAIKVAKPDADAVSGVLSGRYVLKILNGVVFLYSVLVVDLCALWCRANESFRHQPMYEALLVLAAPAKRDSPITSGDSLPLEYASGSSVRGCHKPPDAGFRGYFVETLVALNCAPSFHEKHSITWRWPWH